MKDRFLLAHVTDLAGAGERRVADIAKLPQAPDAVLLTGDLTESGRPEEYQALARNFEGLRVPCFLMAGGHDDPAGLRKHFPSHPYLAQRSGKLDYVVDDFPVRLVALDSSVPGKPYGMLGDEQLDWLEATLAAAPSKPTIVAVNHPPFWTGSEPLDAHPLRNPVAFETVISRHHQVERVACGHLHRGIVRRFGGTVASIGGFQLHLWQAGRGLVTHAVG